MPDQLQRIYRLKVTLIAVATASLGLALLLLAKYAESFPGHGWLRSLPLSELGSTLFITGAFVVVYDYVDGRDKEARENERIRRLLAESAPAMRDAVVRGFAVKPDDLKRVATPQLLDEIATNVLGLRLGDRQFAAELYADLRDQAIRAPERWYDVEVKVRLSTAVERGGTTTPLLDVFVAWEYSVVPSDPVRRFACVSDRDEYYELTTDVPATSTWFMTPRPGLNARNKNSFELVYFSVDGVERPIRRSERKSGQTYSVTLGDDVLQRREPVRIKHIYRVAVAQTNHNLFIEIAQPARNMSLEIDYADTAISRLRVLDLVTSTRRPQLTQLPEQVAGRTASLDVPGWLLPKAGFTLVWTLLSEDGAELGSPKTASGPTNLPARPR